MFSNIQVSEVKTPIMIDQFYCDKGTCKNETAAVAVSGINYMNIKGTYTVQAVHFACSDSLPCIGVSLTTIELKSVQGSHLHDPFCWETYGELKTTTEPPISCLQKGKPSNLPSKLVSCWVYAKNSARYTYLRLYVISSAIFGWLHREELYRNLHV